MLRSMGNIFLLVLALASLSWAQSNERVIFNFNETNGNDPIGGLIADSHGNLYGTTFNGGPAGYGSVFELTPVGTGTWLETVLHNFNGTDGAFPESNLTLDSAGNLYGTALSGGLGRCVKSGSMWLGCGVVFKLTKNGNNWQESTVYAFQPGVDLGVDPNGGVIFDNAGNLYGTTWAPGVQGNFILNRAGKIRSGSSFWGCNLPGCGGTVFKLTPTQNGWQKADIYAFTGGADGSASEANLTLDGSGNVYGTTTYGGNNNCLYGCGVVFKLTKANNTWQETVLHAFSGSDGSAPTSTAVLDQSGNIYSTTSTGGASNQGVVFQLAPNGQLWQELVLHDFTGADDGGMPFGSLILDTHGNLYGTAWAGGSGLSGTVFKLTHEGSQWPFSLVHTFTYAGTDGNGPNGTLVLMNGALFGTTQSGGSTQIHGAVYEVLLPSL